MSEKLLLPSSDNPAPRYVTVVTANYLNEPGRGWRIAAMAVGLFVLIFGASDVASRIAHAAFGSDASLMSFAPAIALESANGLVPTTTAAVAKPATSNVKSGTTAPLIPVRLQIPSIGINAKVEQVSKKADGSMGTPSTFGDVAWYSPGSAPGQAGNAVIDGHVDNALTTAGVFMHLSQIALGDTITVVNASGTPLSFTVSDIEEYPVDSAPAASIFATSGPSQLVLITCDGVWVPSAKSFDKRLVVFATLK